MFPQGLIRYDCLAAPGKRSARGSTSVAKANEADGPRSNACNVPFFCKTDPGPEVVPEHGRNVELPVLRARKFDGSCGMAVVQAVSGSQGEFRVVAFTS